MESRPRMGGGSCGNAPDSFEVEISLGRRCYFGVTRLASAPGVKSGDAARPFGSAPMRAPRSSVFGAQVAQFRPRPCRRECCNPSHANVAKYRLEIGFTLR